MVRQIFKGQVIAAAGPLPDQFTVENLTRWTKLRRGVFTDDFEENVTHLLCTHEQFKDKIPRVREALKRGKKLHIVHYDWFEFSAVSNKKLRECEYSMRNILAAENAKRRERERVERGKREAVRAVNCNLFRVYSDEEGLPYQISITRDDETHGSIGQRYILTLFESIAKPRLYWFVAKFLKKKGDSQPSYYRPSPCSGLFHDEMSHFRHFFQKKTGIGWEERIIKEKTMGNTNFHYTPPTGGKPVGGGLKFGLDRCREMNAQLRGLPWPPFEEPVIIPPSTACAASDSLPDCVSDHQPNTLNGNNMERDSQEHDHVAEADAEAALVQMETRQGPANILGS